MTQPNVDLALGAVDAVARMDVTRLIELTDPEVEWHSFLAQLGEGGVYRGHDGMREYVSDLIDAWDLFSADIHDTLAVGEVVVLVGRLRYRGKASGVDTETAAGWLFKFRRGRVVRFRAFREPEQALEAVGLSE